MDNADKETKPLEVMVKGGTEDDRVHLAMAIGEHFVTNRGFTNAEFKFEDCPKEEVKTKLLRWGDVYSQMNDAMHAKPIAIRALSNDANKSESDKAFYENPLTVELFIHVSDMSEILRGCKETEEIKALLKSSRELLFELTKGASIYSGRLKEVKKDGERTRYESVCSYVKKEST